MKKQAPPIEERQRPRSKAKKKPWRFGSEWLPSKTFNTHRRSGGVWASVALSLEEMQDENDAFFWMWKPLVPCGKYASKDNAIQAWAKVKKDGWRSFDHASVWLENTQTGEKVVLV